MKRGNRKDLSGAGASIELDGTKIAISAAEVEINGSAKVDVKGAVITRSQWCVQTLKGTRQDQLLKQKEHRTMRPAARDTDTIMRVCSYDLRRPSRMLAVLSPRLQ